MTLRFSRDGAALYAGARNELYEYRLESNRFTALVSDIPYYVLDIADYSAGDRVAYVEGQHGLHEWIRSKRIERRYQLDQFQRDIDATRKQAVAALCTAVDYSTDGAQIAFCVPGSGENPEEWSYVLRFDVKAGAEISRVRVPAVIQKVRYVEDTKTLLVWGRPFGIVGSSCGVFGFIAPNSADIHDLRVAKPEKDSIAWIQHGVADPSAGGHVTLGLTDGRLLQWRREDWPDSWVAPFAEGAGQTLGL